jgi:hypothetical protein
VGSSPSRSAAAGRAKAAGMQVVAAGRNCLDRRTADDRCASLAPVECSHAVFGPKSGLHYCERTKVAPEAVNNCVECCRSSAEEATFVAVLQRDCVVRPGSSALLQKHCNYNWRNSA